MSEDLSVRLFSCLGVEKDLTLAGHFLDHYTKLGVEPDKIHIILHADSEDAPALEQAREILSAYGAEPGEIWIGPYTSGELWARRQALQARIAEEDDWVLSADIDEFHEYPLELEKFLAACDKDAVTAVQGPLLDRLAPGGKLEPVDPDKPLTAQFPIEADVMCPIGKIPGEDDATGTVKLMAFKARILPGLGGHNPLPGPGIVFAAGQALASFAAIKEPDFRFNQPVMVHHYKWTERVMEHIQQRLDTPGASEAGSKYGRRILAYLKANDGRVRLEDIPIRADRSGWYEKLRRLRREADANRRSRAKAAKQMKRDLSDTPPVAGEGWTVRRLTEGSERSALHSHSYYDIPVFDHTGRFLAAHRLAFEDRWMKADDAIQVGMVDWKNGGFEPIGETTAWSWQQGPLAQWVPRSDRLVWNTRDGDGFNAHMYDRRTGETRTLPRTVYALDPKGDFTLSLNMARIDQARPGYGYAGGTGGRLDESAPADDGVWRMDLDTDRCELVLSLRRAVEFVKSCLDADQAREHQEIPQLYWFNHVKLSPNGKRFTVKLRWRVKSLKRPWRGPQSVSLTCRIDGKNLRFLIQGGSHVMWLNDRELFCWDQPHSKLVRLEDASRGQHVRDIRPDLFEKNIHIHHLASRPGQYIYDTPYAEEVSVCAYNEYSDKTETLASFSNHRPKHGPFRCDLHPVPASDGNRIVVTSLHDGGRQIYAIERDLNA